MVMNSLRMLLNYIYIVLALVLLSSCSRVPTMGIHDISFTVEENDTSLQTDLTGMIHGDIITVRAPYGTKVQSLKPEIVFKGEVLYPSGDIVQDFTTPVVYTVEGDGGRREYSVVFQVENDPKTFPLAGDGIAGEVLEEQLFLPDGSGSLRITVPPNFKESMREVPLHLHFHGAGGDAYGSEIKFPFNATAGTPGHEFILATWNSGNVDLEKVLDFLVARYPIDVDHIWVSGHSTGAWVALDDVCEVNTTKYNIELSLVISPPFSYGCPIGKSHFIITGSYDFVPLFDHFSSQFLFSHYKSKLKCKAEALKDFYFDGYPREVRRYAAFDCIDSKEVHMYILRHEMHNPKLSKNFMHNLMAETFRITEVENQLTEQRRPDGDHFSYMKGIAVPSPESKIKMRLLEN